MFCLSSVNASVLFQQEKRVQAKEQTAKLQKQQQEVDNQEEKGEQKAELDHDVSAGCFSCYLLHYLRASPLLLCGNRTAVPAGNT